MSTQDNERDPRSLISGQYPPFRLPASSAPVARGVREALAELVAVKDIKDEYSRLKQRRAVVFGRDPDAVAECERLEADYKRRQPAAWEAARKALAASVPPKPIHDWPACALFRGGKCTCDAQDDLHRKGLS